LSRYCGDADSKPILEASQQWREKALDEDGSAFTDKSLWRLDYLEEIDRHYVKNILETDATFLEKLDEQLAPTSQQAKQLVAEMLWVMLLCPGNITPKKKREDVTLIWSWSGQHIDADMPWLSSSTLRGVGNAGQSFNYNRWRELTFFARLMLDFKRRQSAERARLLNDGWAFAEWIATVPEESSRQLRHMLLYLLFPDQFERTFAGVDRRQIVISFSDKQKSDVDSMSPLEIDRELLRIRREQEEKYGTKDLDFYSILRLSSDCGKAADSANLRKTSGANMC
jgi:5-methylcytosine-specific restriction protein B